MMMITTPPLQDDEVCDCYYVGWMTQMPVTRHNDGIPNVDLWPSTLFYNVIHEKTNLTLWGHSGHKTDYVRVPCRCDHTRKRPWLILPPRTEQTLRSIYLCHRKATNIKYTWIYRRVTTDCKKRWPKNVLKGLPSTPSERVVERSARYKNCR